MEKETQQREGQTSTGSLPHHRIPFKSDMSSGKKQPSDLGIERFLQIFDQLKPHILWVIIVAIAIYDYFHPSDVFGFLVLIATAAGSLSLPQAINLLRGRSVSMSLLPASKENEVENQPIEQVADDQNGSK